MIEFLRGSVLTQTDHGAIVDVNGVGYGVFLTEPQRLGIEPGQEAEFWIHSYIKEDSFRLYAFRSESEKKVFGKLLEVNRVGPKLAISILSSLNVHQLCDCILADNPDPLVQVPGVGKTAAQKIVLELKSKIGKLGIAVEGGSKAQVAHTQVETELASALLNLGFKDKEIKPVIKKIAGQDEPLAELLRMALAEMTGQDSRLDQLF